MATSKKSTGETSNDPTLFAEDTPANLSPPPAKGKAKKTRAISGHGYEKPYAHYDPASRSWKMSGDICLLGEPPSLEKLPPSGITRNGVLFLRPPWEPITAATGLSSWPTPTAVTRPMEGNVRLYRAKIEAGEMTEEEAEAILGKPVWEAQGKIPEMWPTPRAHDAKTNASPGELKRDSPGLGAVVHLWPTARASAAMSENLDNVAARMEAGEPYKAKLEQAVALWPTPRAGSLCGGTGATEIIEERYSEGTISPEERQAMRAGNGGKLNPTWVEWLMGFPLGWTDLKDSGTPSSHK
jgi:hypothetical protein